MVKKRKKKVVMWLWASVAVFAVVAACCAWWAWRVCHTSYQGEKVRLYIPRGASEDSMRDSLSVRLGSEFSRQVMRLWRWQDGVAANAEGSYVVEPGTTALDMSRILRYGRQTPVRVTFNNVRTMSQLADRVTANLEICPSDFLSACDSVLPSSGFTAETYPAAFLPDTYEFYWNTSAPSVVSRLLEYRNAFWTQERRDKAAALGLNPAKVATVASIVEEETNKPDERPVVARLYLNRLDRGMMLQADPTVKFAVGDFSLRRIYEKHLRTESPYNTYLHKGLPPGPIRVVEKSTLQQVLDAPVHPYLYMCAKEDFSGYHNFASDYAAHQRNARRYQDALNKRGVK